MPEQKKAVVPRLRFPEFRDAGPWEVKRLGDIGPVCMCKRVLKHQTSDKGDIPFYKIGTFGSKPDAYISKELYESYKSIYPFPNKGDVLISASGTIGRTVVYDGRPAYFQDSNIVWIANKEAIVLNAFLAYCYETVRWPTDDNTIPRLYNDNLRKMKIVVPSRQEQQKIADCLSSLDEVIELEAKKLEALQAHKKGLMQQLFPREGETTPRLRFPEFRDAGPWEVKRLGDESVAKFIRDTAPRSDLHPETYVSTENMLPDFGGITQASSLPASGTIKQYRRQDILIANIRPYLKKVWQADRNGTASNDVIVVRPSSEICPRYLGILLASDTFISYVMAGAKGLKMPRGDIALIKQYPVGLPTKIAEQQKIADCLSSLDELIELQAKQLEALQTHKKGLMQQLFPQEIDL